MNNNYNKEVVERWGNTKEYKEYSYKIKKYSQEELKEIAEGLNLIINKFSLNMKVNEQIDSSTTIQLVEELKKYITQYYYNCTNEILFSLGQMYVSDERFRNNIDKNGIGTANYIKEAIEYYCKINGE